MCPCARILRNERIIVSGRRQWAAAEVHGPKERTRDHHVVARVAPDAVARIDVQAAETLGPNVPAVSATILRHEYIRVPRAGQRSATEIHRTRELSDERDVVVAIDYH